MQFKYLIEVEVERDSGMNASRDDIGTEIENALADAQDGITLSGLGPQSTSEYSVVSFEATEIDNAEMRKLSADHARVVEAEKPKPDEQEQMIRDLRTQLAKAEARATSAERKIEKLTADRAEGKTRIWTGEREAPIYLPDGQYDSVTFELPDGPYRVSISRETHDNEPHLKVYGDTALRTQAGSSNVLFLSQGW